MSAVEVRLAATLAKHRTRVTTLTMTYSSAPYAYKATCSCTWKTRPVEVESGGYALAVEAIDRHLAAVIAGADDLAVIDLPKGVPATDFYDEPITDYLNIGRTQVYVARSEMWEVGKPYTGGYHVQTMTGATGNYSTPDGADRYAAALIAAARDARARKAENA